MDDFNALMRDITDWQLRIIGLPPLPRDSSNDPVQQGSPLWNRLLKPLIGRSEFGPCSECCAETDCYDATNEDYICDDCRMETVRGQERDKFLDSPQRGQASELNKKW